MNERIKELAKEATSYADTLDVADQKIYQEIRYREFAELIVRECAHLVGGYTKENEFGTDVKEAYEEITKHFGVEE